jgi:hypothetical protein
VTATTHTTHGAFLDLIDFVEEHGGAISGEQRDKLWKLAMRLAWTCDQETQIRGAF